MSRCHRSRGRAGASSGNFHDTRRGTRQADWSPFLHKSPGGYPDLLCCIFQLEQTCSSFKMCHILALPETSFVQKRAAAVKPLFCSIRSRLRLATGRRCWKQAGKGATWEEEAPASRDILLDLKPKPGWPQPSDFKGKVIILPG